MESFIVCITKYVQMFLSEFLSFYPCNGFNHLKPNDNDTCHKLNVKKLYFVHPVFRVILIIKSNYFPKEHEAMDLFNEY
jgi:hypothetical protein